MESALPGGAGGEAPILASARGPLQGRELRPQGPGGVILDEERESGGLHWPSTVGGRRAQEPCESGLGPWLCPSEL